MDRGVSSRQGSISLEPNGDGGANSQTHLLANTNQMQQNGDVEHNSLATLARRSTIRKRSVR